MLSRRIYEAGGKIEFCRVVVFAAVDSGHIPKVIAGLKVFHAVDDYVDLIEWLRSSNVAHSQQPETQMGIHGLSPFYHAVQMLILHTSQRSEGRAQCSATSFPRRCEDCHKHAVPHPWR